jgi:hypothetical protein
VKKTLKIIFVISILYWLFKSGRMDFAPIMQIPAIVKNVIISVLLLLVNIIFLTLRLKSLYEHQFNTGIAFKKMLNVIWVGQFFSNLLPGNISGDLVKGNSLKKHNSEHKVSSIADLMITDRIVALFSILMMSSVVCLFQMSQLLSMHQSFRLIIAFNIFMAATLAIVIFMPRLRLRIHDFIKERASFIPFVSILKFVNFKREIILKSVSFAIVSQVLSILSMWQLLNAVPGVSFSLSFAFTIFPIAIIVSSLPVGISGLGLGNLLYSNLFMFIGIENGASLFNLQFIVVMFINLLGGVFYLFDDIDRRGVNHVQN